MDHWRDIRRQARATRALVQPGLAAPASEVLDVLLRHWEIEVDDIPADHPLLRGARAAWREEYGLVLVDHSLSMAERAFAIAHELGHRVCHPGGCACAPGDIDEATLPVALPLGEGRVWGYNPRQAREVEANVFAGELLAPAAELRARFLAGDDYRALANRYGLTHTCILNNLVAAVLGGSADEAAADEAAADGATGDAALDVGQRRAAETVEGRVLVDAGPGTGKTRTLVARVRRLLATGAPGDGILVLTFSNRAAGELRARLRQAVPDAGGVTVSTFHGFALDALRRFAQQAGLPDHFRVIDDVDAALLLEAALPDLGLKEYTHLARPALYLPALLAAAGRMRDDLLTLDTVAAAVATVRAATAEEGESGRLQETLRLLEGYETLLAAHDLVDYGGLITRAVDLFQHDPEVATALRGNLRHVLVDEYQDVNRASAVLLRELVRDGAALWVVGDVRQSIYRFRGAEPGNITGFEDDFPESIRLTLDTNYRAAPALVALLADAAGTITGAPAAWRANRAQETGHGVVLAVAPDERGEEAGIIADLARSIASGRRPDDHAVLCRTHRQAARIADALVSAGLPASYLGNIFLRPEIKDLLALLEMCCALDGSALLRLATWPEYRLDTHAVETVIQAAQGLGTPFPAALREATTHLDLSGEDRERLARLFAHVEAVRYYPDPAAVLLHFLFSDAPYLRRLMDQGLAGTQSAATAIFQLIVLARGFLSRPLAPQGDGATRAFLRYARRLLLDGDAATAQAAAPVAGAVNVLTIHGSKGLEFPVVYVPNLAQGRVPPRARGGVRVALPPLLQEKVERGNDDEPHLFFVALSRARDRLVLSRAVRYGSRRAAPSPFLAAIQAVHPLPETAWPAAAPGAVLVDEVSAESAAVVPARVVEEMARCPAQYRYRSHLGLRGDGATHGYRLFAHLLRDGIGRLRAAHGTAAWPARWDDARAWYTAWWDEQWPSASDHLLGPWYRSAAIQALERAYHDLERHNASPATREFGVKYVVELEGSPVSVGIDAVEEIDGVPHLVLERVTRQSDDEVSLAVAFYSAVSAAIVPERPLPVLIRYLDNGETRAVRDPAAVLARHRPRIRTALDRIARDAFPSIPAGEEDCTRCPLVFTCPR